MRRLRIKQVPDAAPDADGEWIEILVPNRVLWCRWNEQYDRLKKYCSPGHHVVQLVRVYL